MERRTMLKALISGVTSVVMLKTRPVAETGAAPLESSLLPTTCEWCYVRFQPITDGQRFCGNACGGKAATHGLYATRAYAKATTAEEKARLFDRALRQHLNEEEKKTVRRTFTGGARARRRFMRELYGRIE